MQRDWKDQKRVAGCSRLQSKCNHIEGMEKVKASEKKMKKDKDLYEEEKQRHEEALQRYQEDHTVEMEIINLHKKCNKKARKVSQKKVSGSDKPKKVSGPIDDPSGKEKKPNKASSN